MKLKWNNGAKGMRIFAFAMASMLIGSALTYWGVSMGVKERAALVRAESPLAAAPADAKAAIAGAESVQNAIRYVADAVTPSVVEINVVEKVQQAPQSDMPNDFPWNFFFGQPDQRQQKPRSYTQQGLGSGIIVRQSGKTYYVLTNAHVAGSATEISVTTNDQKKYKASLVGKDEKRDIALVKFTAEGTPYAAATLGDSSSVRVGDWAIAIGNPLGYFSSVTAGIISAVHRSGGPEGNINDFIQTDASINPGNSGGALVNIRGEVVGINTWIASQSGGNIGLGFAIPIDNVKKAINDFISKGKVEYGWLGIGLDSPDEATAKELSANAKDAVIASSVVKSSPAQKGGILPGDVIKRIDGQDVTGVDQVQRIVAELPTGKQTEVDVLRQGHPMTLHVGITVRDDKLSSDAKAYTPGIVVRSLRFDQLDQASLPKGVRGVFVADVADKSPAAVVGVQAQDIITGVNDKSVSSVAEFYAAINDPKSSKVSFTLWRDGQTLSTAAYSK